MDNINYVCVHELCFACTFIVLMSVFTFTTETATN